MRQLTLGKTGIVTPQNAFGCLPIQRISSTEAEKLLRKAYEGGITFFDTARAYSDSEEKLGRAFKGLRDKVFIASKTQATKPEDLRKDLETTLRNLQTDYLDLYQLHNTPRCFRPDDGTGLYEALYEAKEKGLVRHIGFTTHRVMIAEEGIASGLYETLQYPFSYVSTEQELALPAACAGADMGFIAMKALAGGLLTDADTCMAFIAGYENVLPIWGIQREAELDQFLGHFREIPAMTPARQELIAKDRAELAGEFCRGCGYCMPCTVGIKINTAARMIQMIRRSPSAQYLTPEWQQNMLQIEDCVDCGQCASKCPYGLNTPELLRKNLEDYKNILSGKTRI